MIPEKEKIKGLVFDYIFVYFNKISNIERLTQEHLKLNELLPEKSRINFMAKDLFQR